MIAIKINGKEHLVKALSELTFSEFNTMIAEREMLDLPSYLSMFCGISEEELNASEYSGISLTSLYQQIFNVDIAAVVKDEKETISYGGKIRAMSDVSINTFGKSYLAELKRQLLSEGKINNYEYNLYILACGLSVSPGGDDVDYLYEELKGLNWMKVIPQSFFLLRRGTSFSEDYRSWKGEACR
jgi:hypothetical protein